MRHVCRTQGLETMGEKLTKENDFKKFVMHNLHVVFSEGTSLTLDFVPRCKSCDPKLHCLSAYFKLARL